MQPYNSAGKSVVLGIRLLDSGGEQFCIDESDYLFLEIQQFCKDAVCMDAWKLNFVHVQVAVIECMSNLWPTDTLVFTSYSSCVPSLS